MLSRLLTNNFFARDTAAASSSNFPRFIRNLNTRGPVWSEAEGVVAHDAIHLSREYPSVIRLPIVRR